MPDLADFLLARTAEDEADARRAAAVDDLGPVWRAGRKWEDFAGIYASGIEVADMPDTGVAPHIARWDPARVLAECQAKRRIVEHHGSNGDDDFALCVICTEVGPDAQGWPCQTLRLLALSYADHEDYRPEWKPT
jgi:hypothetical protein